MAQRTPVTPEGLRLADDWPAEVAVAYAWDHAGRMPWWHRLMQRKVRKQMPLLARSLDRLVKEVLDP